MTQENFDQMIEHTIECLFDTKTSNRAVVRDLVRLWPQIQILDVTFVLVAAANSVDSWFAKGSPSREQSTAAYKMAALVSLDYYVMQSLKMPCGSAADLQAYWTKCDGYFLND